MGYTSVDDRRGAVAAAARLAMRTAVHDLAAALPALVDQVGAEAGVYEPAAAGRAIEQAGGDSARAVSLLRAWSSTMTRLGACRASLGGMRVLRRITPGIAEPTGGQYLGASLDYAQRLLDLGGGASRVDPPGAEEDRGPADDNGSAGLPADFPRAAAGVEAEGLVAPVDPAVALDLTRSAVPPSTSRGSFLQWLARAETGALTALAYSGLRGQAQRQDPTLVELRGGWVAVTVAHGITGRPMVVGEVPVTSCEVLQYGAHDQGGDARFVLGVGVTTGRVERRAIAAAMLDASCARGGEGGGTEHGLTEDRELLSMLLDGQEAAGFVEHLKLPHHVTFASDLDVVRRAGAGGPPAEPA